MLEELSDNELLHVVGGANVVFTAIPNNPNPTAIWGYFSCDTVGYNVKYTGSDYTNWANPDYYQCVPQSQGGMSFYEVKYTTTTDSTSSAEYTNNSFIANLSLDLHDSYHYLQIGYNYGAEYVPVYDSHGTLSYYDNGSECVAPAAFDTNAETALYEEGLMASAYDNFWGGSSYVAYEYYTGNYYC